MSGFLSAGIVGGSDIPVLSNYLDDDFNDGSFSRPRTEQEDGEYTDDTGTTLTTARVRPDWTVLSGNPDANSGYIAGTNAIIETTSELMVGEFKVQHRITTTQSDFSDRFRFIENSSGDAYSLFKQSADFNDGAVRLRRNNTNLFVYDWDFDTNFHEEKVTRSSSGDFESFEDGVSKGTATDTVLQNSERMSLGMGHDFETQYDDLITR